MEQSNWTCNPVQSQPTFLCSAGSELTQFTLSAASDKGPRAATLRQTTLRLHCRAQLAQSTSKSLSQNIVGKTTKQLPDMQSKLQEMAALQTSRLMHSCTLTLAPQPRLRCGGKWHTQCRKAGRFVRGMGDARATERRTKQSEHGQRNASPLTAFPVPGNSVPAEELLLAQANSRGSNRAECKRDLQATYGLRYLSRLRQLLLKELGYSLLRQRASAAAPCKRTAG